MVRRKRLAKNILVFALALCMIFSSVQPTMTVKAEEVTTEEAAEEVSADETSAVDTVEAQETGEEGSEGEDQSDDADSADAENGDTEEGEEGDATNGDSLSEEQTQEETSGNADSTEEEADGEENSDATGSEDESSDSGDNNADQADETQGEGADQEENDSEIEEAESTQSVSTTAGSSLLTAASASVAALFSARSISDKILTVDATAATEVKGETYTTIQAAINYISKQEDITGWTITVRAGDYARFTVLNGMDGLTVKAAEGETVTISTMDGSENPDKASGACPETDGISIRNAQNVTLDGLTITMGTTKRNWVAAGVSNYTEQTEKGDNLTVKNCTFKGSGTGYAVFINTGTTKFTVTNCTFDSVYDGVEMYGDGTLMKGASVTYNTFTNCAFAMHGYYGGTGDADTLTFAYNTVTGTSDLRTKVVVQDQNNTGALKVDVHDNTLSYALVGLVNLQEDGETVSDVLASNTFGDSSFYVDAVEPGSIDVTYASYQAPSSDGYWVLTGIENNSLISYNASVDADILDAIQTAIDEANASSSKTLNITSVDVDGDGEVDENELIRTFTWCKDAIYWVSNTTGSLAVEKDIVYGNSSKEFTFTVKIDTSGVKGLEDLSLNGAYGTKTNADGSEEKVEFVASEATFTLSDGESVKLENLPAGATYTVTEASTAKYTATIEATDEIAEVDGSSITGTVLSEGTTVSYTNTYSPSGDGSSSSEWATSKSKEATNLDENYESVVTLSLPSAQEQLVSDIVFVLDKSTSTDTEQDILDMLTTLKNQIAETSASVRVGVVIFNKTGNVMCELTDLATGYETIEAAIKTEVKSGTNLHAGLMAGKEMLDEDTSVDASRKYLIVVSDGITYMYDTDGKISAYYWMNDGSPYYSTDNNAWKFKYGNNTAPASWDTWISEIGTILETVSETEVLYDNKDSFTETNATYAGNLAENQYTTNVDRALYYSYQTYTAAQDAGYHCFAVMKETTTEYAWGPSFMNYLAGGATVDFSAIENNILYLLDVGSTVVDVIGYGTDNAGNEYEFDFVNDKSKLTLTVGEVTYTTSVSTEALDANETSRYIFTADGVTAKNGAEAPFVLHYYKNGTDGASDECFVWDINVPISNFEQVQLSYSVVLTNPQEADGTYGTYDQYGENRGTELYTNVSATLYPVDSEGNSSAPEEFLKPTVSYEKVSLSGTKIWDDADDQDGKRPDSITVNLRADGEVIDTVTVTADDDWSFSFNNLRQWDDDDADYITIEYTIIEDTVTDYSPSISYSEDGTVAEITNSYTPGQTSVTVTKIWNDSNNLDQIRPDSVTVKLLKNGTETGDTLTLSSSNKWTGSFTGLDEYTDGTANVYTVAEVAVTGYTATVTGDASTGFTITNTHTVVTTETEDPGDTTDPETTETVTEDPVEVQEAESTVIAEVVSAVTGDNAPIGIAILLAAISEIALITLIILQIRKKKDEVI